MSCTTVIVRSGKTVAMGGPRGRSVTGNASSMPARGRSVFQYVICAAIRTLRGATVVDNGQVDLGMRVPKVHARHGAGQRKVRFGHFVAVLGVGRDELGGRGIGMHGET